MWLTKHPEGSWHSHCPAPTEHLCPERHFLQFHLHVLFASGFSKIQDHPTACSQERSQSSGSGWVSFKSTLYRHDPLSPTPSSVLPIHRGLEVSGHGDLKPNPPFVFRQGAAALSVVAGLAHHPSPHVTPAYWAPKAKGVLRSVFLFLPRWPQTGGNTAPWGLGADVS